MQAGFSIPAKQISPLQLKFEIVAHFWVSKPFYILCCLIIGLLFLDAPSFCFSQTTLNAADDNDEDASSASSSTDFDDDEDMLEVCVGCK